MQNLCLDLAKKKNYEILYNKKAKSISLRYITPYNELLLI